MDLIGIDTAYEILDTMYKQARNRLHAPEPMIKQMVTAGLLGRKSGRGFYTYAEPGSAEVVADARDAAGDGRHRGRPAGAARSASSAPARWPPASSRCSPRPATTSRFVARAPDKVEAVPQGAGQVAGEAGAARQARRGRPGRRLGRVTGTTTLDDLADVDLVVEAVVEELGVKQALFANLGEIAKPGAVLATTTSSLPVIECAKATGRPADVVGMHFFNPAQVMKLVEVVSHDLDRPRRRRHRARGLRASWASTRCRCTDRAGFIVNALLFPYLNDAVKMLEAHYATADDIDAAMKVGCGYPMGPFELLDVVGLDVSLAIQRELYLEFREPGFAPAPLLEHLVTAGYLGRKTGRGFRDYARR